MTAFSNTRRILWPPNTTSPAAAGARSEGEDPRAAGVVTVMRTVVDGKVKPYGKTERSLRAVPLPARAAEALDGLAVRLDTRMLFPASRGGPLALQPWRWREWDPALRAGGVEHRTPYAMRHTYASLSIAAGVSLFELSRLMGTSPSMLDKTYGHMLPDASTGRVPLSIRSWRAKLKRLTVGIDAACEDRCPRVRPGRRRVRGSCDQSRT
jgi:hypothetical protein